MGKGNEFLSCAIEKIIVNVVYPLIRIIGFLSSRFKSKKKHDKCHVVINQQVVYLM